jgi:hypothetical protein
MKSVTALRRLLETIGEADGYVPYGRRAHSVIHGCAVASFSKLL